MEPLSSLTPAQHARVLDLCAAAEAADTVAPLNEEARLQLGRPDALHWVARDGDTVVGYAQWQPANATGQLVVHPDHRSEGVGAELLREALRAHPDSAVWAFGTLPGGDSLARRLGLFPVRTLLRMERPLEGADLTAEVPDGYRIVTYTPDLAADLLKLNAQAFAHHPEQGRLTAKEFEDLTRQPWFDPAGFFVAMHGSEVAGLHWTKRHDGGLGEVYVLAVAPAHEGKGLFAPTSSEPWARTIKSASSPEDNGRGEGSPSLKSGKAVSAVASLTTLS